MEDILSLGPANHPECHVEIDLMTPIHPEHTPKVHVPPLNHIGLWVDDLPAAVEWMTTYHKVRLTPGGIRIGAAGHPIAFIHPKTTVMDGQILQQGGNGVLIELVQAPTKVIQAYRRHDRHPPTDSVDDF